MKNLFFTSRAKKNFKQLDTEVKNSIIKKLQNFKKDDFNAIPLSGTWKGWYKIRVGDYRILLMKQGKDQWIVGYIRHRREVYKN